MSDSSATEKCSPPDDDPKNKSCHSVTFTIPMKRTEHAKIVRASLQADPEPERSYCLKVIEAVDGELKIRITCDAKTHDSTTNMKNLRNATTNFFELLDLVLQTIDQFSEN